MASPPVWTLVPREALLHTFSYLGTPKDLGACACVCRTFCDIASEPELWQRIALDKYGSVCANLGHNNFYGGDWRMLLRDDNRYAALPTIHFNKTCYWKFNSDRRFYGCFIAQIKWNRATEQVLIYLDARGEFDLRDPVRSTVGFGRSGPTLPGQWIPYVAVNGHFKGCIMFSEAEYKNNFTERADGQSVTFCYANPDHVRGDYTPIEFPSWQQISTSMHYTTHGSPFAEDTNESELERWRTLVPTAVLQRRPDIGRNPGFVLQRVPGIGRNPGFVVSLVTGTWWVETRSENLGS